MEQKKDFVKIRVFTPINSVVQRSENAGLTASDEFIEQASEADAKFREPIITFINEAIGLHNWAIKFIYTPPEFGYEYRANIYCPTNENFVTIVEIIKEKIPTIIFQFTHKGTIDNYLNT